MEILFVCAANTCRSPIAEAIFNYLNKDDNNRAKSAGISIVPGSIVSKNSADLVYREMKLDINNRRAVQINSNKLENTNIVLTMTKYGRDYIKEYYPKYTNKIFTLSEYVGLGADIADPYGNGITVYKKVYEQINRAVSLLLLKIMGDESI